MVAVIGSSGDGRRSSGAGGVRGLLVVLLPRRSPSRCRGAAPRMFSTVSIAVNIEWSWLLYLCMPLRPTGYTFGACRSSHSRSTSHVGLVVLVVHRIRLRHAHDVARLDLRRRRRGRCCASSRLPSSMRSSSAIVHMLVALVHEVLEAEAGAPVLHHVRRPRPEVLDAADLDVGDVDVDPVVGEASTSSGTTSATVRKSRYVSVVGRGQHARRAAGGSIARSSALIGIDEMTSVHGVASWRTPSVSAVTATARPSSWSTCVTTACPSATLRARGRDLVAAHAPTSSRARTSGTGTPR